MENISNSIQLRHENLPGVTIYSWEQCPRVGVQQEVLVEVDPNSVIPLHIHSVDATMIIVAGKGVVLSENPSLQGRKVQKGDVVFFELNVPHGFRASSSGLTFISRNGGIVDANPKKWDLAFC